MKPEDQRTAIAEACPDLVEVTDDYESGFSYGEGNVSMEFDPLSDLNAMHEVEEIAIRGHYDMEYREILEQVCKEGYAVIVFATAAQRAEAVLRTIGRWKE